MNNTFYKLNGFSNQISSYLNSLNYNFVDKCNYDELVIKGRALEEKLKIKIELDNEYNKAKIIQLEEEIQNVKQKNKLAQIRNDEILNNLNKNIYKEYYYNKKNENIISNKLTKNIEKLIKRNHKNLNENLDENYNRKQLESKIKEKANQFIEIKNKLNEQINYNNKIKEIEDNYNKKISLLNETMSNQIQLLNKQNQLIELGNKNNNANLNIEDKELKDLNNCNKDNNANNKSELHINEINKSLFEDIKKLKSDNNIEVKERINDYNIDKKNDNKKDSLEISNNLTHNFNEKDKSKENIKEFNSQDNKENKKQLHTIANKSKSNSKNKVNKDSNNKNYMNTLKKQNKDNNIKSFEDNNRSLTKKTEKNNTTQNKRVLGSTNVISKDTNKKNISIKTQDTIKEKIKNNNENNTEVLTTISNKTNIHNNNVGNYRFLIDNKANINEFPIELKTKVLMYLLKSIESYSRIVKSSIFYSSKALAKYPNEKSNDYFYSILEYTQNNDNINIASSNNSINEKLPYLDFKNDINIILNLPYRIVNSNKEENLDTNIIKSVGENNFNQEVFDNANKIKPIFDLLLQHFITLISQKKINLSLASSYTMQSVINFNCSEVISNKILSIMEIKLSSKNSKNNMFVNNNNMTVNNTNYSNNNKIASNNININNTQNAMFRMQAMTNKVSNNINNNTDVKKETEDDPFSEWE